MYTFTLIELKLVFVTLVVHVAKDMSMQTIKGADTTISGCVALLMPLHLHMRISGSVPCFKLTAITAAVVRFMTCQSPVWTARGSMFCVWPNSQEWEWCPQWTWDWLLLVAAAGATASTLADGLFPLLLSPCCSRRSQSTFAITDAPVTTMERTSPPPLSYPFLQPLLQECGTRPCDCRVLGL